MSKATVLTMRREWDDLTDEEQLLIMEALNRSGITDIVPDRIDPIDVDDQLEICIKNGSPENVVVILPKDTPIPLKAMRKGYPHLAVISGQVMRLISIQANFELYLPES